MRQKLTHYQIADRPAGAPDFVRLAESFGAAGLRATSPDQLRAALHDALEALRAAGVELSYAELAAFTRVAREDVWAEDRDEIGSDAMAQLNAQRGLTQ